jgi:hypothetical protein
MISLSNFYKYSPRSVTIYVDRMYLTMAPVWPKHVV